VDALPEVTVGCGPVYGGELPCVVVLMQRELGLDEAGESLGEPGWLIPEGVVAAVEDGESVLWRPGQQRVQEAEVLFQLERPVIAGEGKEDRARDGSKGCTEAELGLLEGDLRFRENGQHLGLDGLDA